VAERLGRELVPDGLWKIVKPLIPPQRDRPQGGGTRHVDDRAEFTTVVYVLTIGCAWRHLPVEFLVSKATAHRRFVAWTAAGCGGDYTGKSSTASVSKAGSTGPARWSTRPACERKRG
jgi:hypothetical protein